MLLTHSSGDAYPRENFLISFVRAVGFFLFYYAVRTVIFNAAYLFFAVRYHDTELAQAAYLERANMLSCASGVCIIVLLLLFFVMQKKSVVSAFYIGKPSALELVLCFVTGISLNFTTSFVISRLPEKLLNSYAEAAGDLAKGSLLWYILATVVMAPILEELIFRAMMISRFSTATGNAIAIVLASAVFGAVHGHIVWSTYAFILGLLLGFVFVRLRSLAASITFHVGFNCVALISRLAPSTKNVHDIFSLLQMISVAISLILLFILIKKTAARASRIPVGIKEI